MQSKIKNIELLKTFPCLMEYRLQGSHPVGVYLVSKVIGAEGGREYSVCLVAPADEVSMIGEMYFKDSLNPEEWFHLPIGTTVHLTNAK